MSGRLKHPGLSSVGVRAAYTKESGRLARLGDAHERSLCVFKGETPFLTEMPEGSYSKSTFVHFLNV